jgi:DNA-directed RNA polymerase subunit M/transcription elongation factor TFIIS
MSSSNEKANRDSVFARAATHTCKNCQSVMVIVALETGSEGTTINYHCKQCGADETVKTPKN